LLVDLALTWGQGEPNHPAAFAKAIHQAAIDGGIYFRAGPGLVQPALDPVDHPALIASCHTKAFHTLVGETPVIRPLGYPLDSGEKLLSY